MEENGIIVFGLSSADALTEEICRYLKVERGKIKISHFADGEIIVEPEEKVRGKHVFVICSTCNPVNDNLMEMLIAVDAIRRASSAEITCVIPYFGYARQERKSKPRQPITARLVADMIESAGVDRVVCIDLHAIAIQGFFRIPSDNMTAVALFGQYFRAKHIEGDLVVVSPDHGGATRARQLAEYVKAPIAIVDKRRVRPNEAEALALIGDCDGKTAIIVDDLIDTGGSLCGAAKMLKEKGAKEVYCCCTHGVLSNNAVERINNSDIKELILTNTIPMTEERKSPKIKVLSIGYMLARTIEAIYNKSSVSDIYAMFNED